MKSYNFKQTNVLASQKLANTTNSTELISRANDTTILIKEGIIESLYLVNDCVFAIIRKNYVSEFSPTGDELDHGDGWFNNDDGTAPTELTIPELAVRTDINPINSNLNRYIGKRCRVTVKNNIAMYAQIDYGTDSMTVFPTPILKEIRYAVKDSDIFSEEARNIFKKYGFTDNQINDLKKLKYTDEQKEKIMTFKDEAVWIKDNAKKKSYEVILDALSIVNGLNSQGMKTKDCHLPTRLFSGK